ncbi:MAG: hypothetical protein KGL02_08760, partial [Acidobacteriota bacterium]|nr:hypothetical protein [Acidobacteriota bacterium]
MNMDRVGHAASEIPSLRSDFDGEVEAIVQSNHGDPFRILGPHWVEREGRRFLAVRGFRRSATKAEVVWKSADRDFAADRIHADGLFEALIAPESAGLRERDQIAPGSYRWRFIFADGRTIETFDPYAFPPVLTDYDLYLSGEGT